MSTTLTQHKPVLAQECLEQLKPEAGQTYIDGTLGGAGHSKLILESGARLYSFDQDINVIKSLTREAQTYNDWTLVHDNFANLWQYCKSHHIKIDGGILLDLGLSSIQLDDPERGFSFNADTPLDMRLNPEADLTAADVVNVYSETDLANIIYHYGEERKARKIAKAIKAKRPINTCQELGDLIKNIYARGSKGKTFKIHPATKTFQALRIYVNKELEALEQVLGLDFSIIKPGARIAVISFHSLEDRIVKHAFKALAKEGKLKILTKKPLSPSKNEQKDNPRARSAKLRVAEVIHI